MTTIRILPGVLLALAATAGPAAAQYATDPSAQPGRYPGLVPSALPPGSPDSVTVMPPGRPVAAGYGYGASATALDRVTAPVRQASGEQSDPVGTLTGQQVEQTTPGLPPGSYPSPWFSDGPGCCGPMGRNGRVGYDLDVYTGPTWSFGNGRFARELQAGWMVGGDGASLLFNPQHDAAWVIDLGWSYQYNRGSPKSFQTLIVRQPPITVGTTTIAQPDSPMSVAIHALDRTNFNFALGRDWWLWGPGSTGMANGWNLRIGGLVGGRWGTAHVDLIPEDESMGYRRRQGVTHGIFISPRADLEVPMGTWILFAGLRFEWSYDWMNLVPPLNGNLNSFNLLMTGGIRF